MGACKTCYSQKTIKCPVCQGNGKVNGQTCHQCKGDRKIVCPKCGGTGNE